MIGISITSSNVLAMDSERGNAGIASAILGGMAYVVGGVVAPFVGMGGDIMMNTALLFTGVSLCSYVLWRFTLPRYGNVKEWGRACKSLREQTLCGVNVCLLPF